jgi:hypothetical protein
MYFLLPPRRDVPLDAKNTNPEGIPSGKHQGPKMLPRTCLRTHRFREKPHTLPPLHSIAVKLRDLLRHRSIWVYLFLFQFGIFDQHLKEWF